MARPRWAGLLRRILAWGAVAAVLAAGVAAFVVYREVTADLPPVDQLLKYQPPVATRIFADDGTLIGEFYVERRYLVPLATIPPHVRLAFLAAEDADFYRHHGVNPLSIVRASIANLLHHQVVQGGSTITQQVVKALLLTPERSYERKVKELVLALRLEAPWYVGHVGRLIEERYGGPPPCQIGRRVYAAVARGMRRAAEAALRAGLTDLDRRQGFRGPVRHLDLRKADAFLAHLAAASVPDAGRPVRAVVTEVRPAGLVVRSAADRGTLPADGLVWGKTRVLPGTFRAGDVISVTPTGHNGDGTPRFALDQEPQVEGALVCMDPYTGEVRAMVGGFDFNRSQFNRAVQARRQPGSGFKPLVYAAAIEHGYTPASIVLDAPIELPNGNQPAWVPRNYEGKYFGPTPLRMALARSLNSVTVRLVDAMGIDYVRKSLGRFGLEATLPRNLSLALGSAEVTPLELVRAYGVFATLGKRFDPIFITRVTDSEANPLEFGHTRPHFEPVMSPATAYVVTNMMESVVKHGTGRKAAELGRPVAGKTGTTNDTHDAWFIGFTPDLLAGVWVGFDSERSLGAHETGGHAAAPIWTELMKEALGDRPVVDFPVPEGVTFAQIDPASGLRAVPGGESELEVFLTGSEPTRYATAPEANGIEPAAAPADGSVPDTD